MLQADALSYIDECAMAMPRKEAAIPLDKKFIKVTHSSRIIVYKLF